MLVEGKPAVDYKADGYEITTSLKASHYRAQASTSHANLIQRYSVIWESLQLSDGLSYASRQKLRTFGQGRIAACGPSSSSRRNGLFSSCLRTAMTSTT